MTPTTTETTTMTEIANASSRSSAGEGTKPCYRCGKPVMVEVSGMLMVPDGSRPHDCNEDWTAQHGYDTPAVVSSDPLGDRAEPTEREAHARSLAAEATEIAYAMQDTQPETSAIIARLANAIDCVLDERDARLLLIERAEEAHDDECGVVHPAGLFCDRPKAHGGRHAAYSKIADMRMDFGADSLRSGVGADREAKCPPPVTFCAAAGCWNEPREGSRFCSDACLCYGRPREPLHRSVSCNGETCTLCGKPADLKVGEEIMHDDPHPDRHNLTAYICARCGDRLLRPYLALRSVRPSQPAAAGETTLDELKWSISQRAADALAGACCRMVDRDAIDARSEIGDALLDYASSRHGHGDPIGGVRRAYDLLKSRLPRPSSGEIAPKPAQNVNQEDRRHA
jgi:hypothetical protein